MSDRTVAILKLICGTIIMATRLSKLDQNAEYDPRVLAEEASELLEHFIDYDEIGQYFIATRR